MSDVKLESLEQKASYGIGCQMGRQLSQSGLDDVDLAAVAKGLVDGYKGGDLQLSVDEIESAMTTMNKSMQEKAANQAKELAGDGEKFLEDNAKRDEVVVLESGLQYEILQAGEGDVKPSATATVRTHYHGTLVNGEVFDSSYERGSPIQFDVNGVIPGWTEALQLMTTGAKWKLFIPYNLAYGEQGAGSSIPPFATLIFDVELMEII